MSGQHATTVDASQPGRTAVAASAGAGVLAAAVGYALSYLLVGSEASENFERVAEWKGVAWYHYSAHLVDVEAGGSIGGFSGTTTVNVIAESGSASAQLLYLVPPVVLALTGAVLARRLGARDLGDAVAAAAPVAVGYGLVMGLGALVAEAGGEATVIGVEVGGSMAPQLIPAIVLAGVLYPLVFATAGAALATAQGSR
ncbi:hypothetical protein [Halovivax sp.]|uniref:hypothetical protein n=1 Tax=Halovivax sp. TaxID=1935978 RepID=UPI0025B9733F|nr:hypothetical protein [Halovivax sp.]